MRTVSRFELRGYKGRGKGSKFIVWFTFALKGFSHISMVWHFTDGTGTEIEAIQGEGVIEHPPKFGPEYNFETRIVPVNEQQAWEAYQLALSIVGADYDWKGIFGFLRRKITESPDKWFCSESAAWVLWKINHPLSRRKPFQETPEMVMDSKQVLTEDEFKANEASCSP